MPFDKALYSYCQVHPAAVTVGSDTRWGLTRDGLVKSISFIRFAPRKPGTSTRLMHFHGSGKDLTNIGRLIINDSLSCQHLPLVTSLSSQTSKKNPRPHYIFYRCTAMNGQRLIKKSRNLWMIFYDAHFCLQWWTPRDYDEHRHIHKHNKPVPAYLYHWLFSQINRRLSQTDF